LPPRVVDSASRRIKFDMARAWRWVAGRGELPPQLAGTSGVVLAVVGAGQTRKQAQAQVYARIKNILIPNRYYRTDIGDRWAEDSDKLHNWGYLR
jgi:phosphoribosylamine-glycine ligase